MELKELERLACENYPLPDELCLPEIWFYEAMRNVYRQYRAGTIQKEVAVQEKREVYRAYRDETKRQELMKTCMTRQQENLMRSDRLRCEINLEKDPIKRLELALECVRCLTGDELVGRGKGET